MSGATTNTQLGARHGLGLGVNGSNAGRDGPLTSLYLVAGLPKSHHAWTLADPDSVLGLQHSDGAVGRWWRPEVLGSTVSPGVAPGSKDSKEAGAKGPAGAAASSAASVDTRKRRKSSNATIPSNAAGGANAGANGAANANAAAALRDPGAAIGMSKPQVAKMLSKALKLSFTREVEIIASTLQPASTVHTFTFSLPTPAPSDTLDMGGVGVGAGRSAVDVRSSVYSAPNGRGTMSGILAGPGGGGMGPGGPGGLGAGGMGMLASARPSSTYLGPTTTPLTPAAQEAMQAEAASSTTFYGVCLTVWSHADEERSKAIRRTVEMRGAGGASVAGGGAGGGSMRRRRKRTESSRAGKEKVPPVPSLPGGANSQNLAAARSVRTSNPDTPAWSGTDAETEPDVDQDEYDEDGLYIDDGTDTGGVSESDWEGRNRTRSRAEMGESALFLGGDTIFWLPYALTLVSRVPIYDLMRDFLTFSWARFSKDVHSHTLQIAKILSAPVPKPGEFIKLDASPGAEKEKERDRSGKAISSSPASLEMICRMPGGLDFGKGLVDVNFQMWPLFCCLSLDNILTCCEIALSPTGRVLFTSRHPAMLGIAVSTIKYLVELRGWNGIALQAVHSRDAKIYLEDPGPWILGLATEARYLARTAPEVCICDLDINYVNCVSPPPGHVSSKGQRDRYRRILLGAFDAYFHPDHSIPSEFKEAFPAGRFRPVVKIQSRRGASSSVGTEAIDPPDWWNWTRVVAAFNEVLQHRDKPVSLIKRIANIRKPSRQAKLSPAELLIQMALRKRASAFVDARDDLETKIGRLSRRLNFLLTESDLWREKFVQFEAYAEKLSTEAIDLRNKINKEQRESRRLTSLVTMTAQEKQKLQIQLQETEGAQRMAAAELDRMKHNMEKMENERAQMVAEVEAQIERALQSMMIGDSDMEWDEDDLDEIPNEHTSPARVISPIIDSAGEGPSRPLSPRSIVSSHHGKRRRLLSQADAALSDGGKSIGGKSIRSTKSAGNAARLRSFGTASTLAEIADKLEQVKNAHGMKSRASSRHGHATTKSRASSNHGHGSDRGGGGKLKPSRSEQKLSSDEPAEDSSLSEKERQELEREKAIQRATKRFSTGAAEGGKNGTTGGDGMMSAVDAGIVEKSDRIAEKVKQIQQRFESALAAEEAAAAEAGSELEQDPNEPLPGRINGSDEEQEVNQPAPLTSISPRPRPSRASRPAPTRARSKEMEGLPASNPTTPTASTHRRRVGSNVALADTEAWRNSVMTAQSEEREQTWRESLMTATTASVEQHPFVPASKARSQDSNHSSIKASSIPRLKKVGSNASVGAFVPSPTTPPASANTSTMHSDSMSSGAHYNVGSSRFRPESRGGITTDNDSDADFQSAYSTSPRLTAGGTSDLERAGSRSGYNSAGRRRSRQGIPTPEPRNQLKTLARRPSLTNTTISTGAVGGLGLVTADLDSRSRASSIGTNLEAASTNGKSTSGSDHTVGFPEQRSAGLRAQD
ncbi:hypothetical protein M408DRAFT_26482 [Serendipita vermifera MAFF 305830]|uniref:cDENN domain-containing protein n=1 Tax=Serendipita vermifera MAFF 305830 TaxID=933852 RepID=A0A0C2WF73_SERVB|nr:hypothetical protein M408DRAFT_26482 [Serendipita vermifera MAFF 305830]